MAELRPLVEGAAKPSTRALREYGDTLTGLGYATLNFGDALKSIEYLRRSQEVFRQLGAPKAADLSIDAGYASATAWLANALDSADQRTEARAKYEESLSVANRILDAMPGHATGLHVKGLALSSLTEMDTFDLRIAKALARAKDNEGVYEGMVKIATTNTASLNNLGVARTHTANALFESGRIAEARDKFRAAAAVREKMLKIGSFQARNAMIWLGIAADFDAELGEFASAKADLAEARRLWEQHIKPTSAPLVVGFSRLWLEGFDAGIALHEGNASKALQQARGILAGTSELKPVSRADGEWLRRLRIRANQVIGVASLELGDFAAAETSARAILADQKGLPKWDGPFGSDRDRAGFEVLLAAAVARQGRSAEAREILKPALKYHRDQYARRHDSVFQHFELAQAVYVAALTEPEKRGALLAEATALLDSIPPALSKWKTGQRLRADIAKARQARP